MTAAVVSANRIALKHLGALKTLGPLEIFVCDCDITNQAGRCPLA